MPGEVEGHGEAADVRDRLAASLDLEPERTARDRRVVGNGRRQDQVEAREGRGAPAVQLLAPAPEGAPALRVHLPPELDARDEATPEVGLALGEERREAREQLPGPGEPPVLP